MTKYPGCVSKTKPWIQNLSGLKRGKCLLPHLFQIMREAWEEHQGWKLIIPREQKQNFQHQSHLQVLWMDKFYIFVSTQINIIVTVSGLDSAVHKPGVSQSYSVYSTFLNFHHNPVKWVRRRWGDQTELPNKAGPFSESEIRIVVHCGSHTLAYG